MHVAVSFNVSKNKSKLKVQKAVQGPRPDKIKKQFQRGNQNTHTIIISLFFYLYIITCRVYY